MTNIYPLFPNIVYYNDDHSKSPVCTGELSAINGAVWTLPSTWQDLTREIERGEDKIVFHIDMITKSGESIKEFIKSLKTIVKFMPGHKPLKILVLITPTTTQQQIKELKASGIQGIGYDVTYYSFEQAAEATTALIAGEPYWPEYIISQLPATEKKPVNVFFRKDCDEYFKTIGGPEAVKRLSTDAPWQVLKCSSWEELGKAMEASPHQICLHVDMVTKYGATMNECVSMIETLLRVSNLKNIPIGLGIDKDTPLALVKEAQKCGVYGIVPSAKDFGLDAAYNGLDALYNRIPYWPKHVLEQLPGFIKKPATSGLTLTDRQAQVFSLIRERGASNKVIARILGISESTVKLHVTEIFKKYGVRNRTQLAVFSK